MKTHILGGGLLLACVGCSSTAYIEDGNVTCLSGSTVEFEPPLSGEGIQASVTVDTDFGNTASRFSSPFTCDFATGTDPERTSRCSGVAPEIYEGISDGEVGPPIVAFGGEDTDEPFSYSATGIAWGYLSESARVTVVRAGETLFDGEVNLEDSTCNGAPTKSATIVTTF